MASNTSCFEISPCTQDDIPGVCEVYIRAFEPMPMDRIWAGPVSNASRMTWAIRRFSKQLAHREMAFHKIVDTSTGKIIAMSKWTCPHTLSIAEKEAREAAEKALNHPRWPEGALEEAADRLFSGLKTSREKWVNAAEHYECDMLAVDPAYQKKGLGRRLMRVMLDRVDKEGRIAYIEATPEGHPLYLELGWKDVGTIDVDMSQWGLQEPGRFWVMLRDPEAAT